MSKLSRGEKGEAKVNKLLLSIKGNNVLINDVTFVNKNSEMSHQIDHIFIHPHGIFLIETKNYYGEIFVKNQQWKRIINNKVEKLPDPLRQNKSHAITLNKILKNKYEIIPVVVFVKNNAPYLGDENVINIDDLSLFIDSYPYQKLLSKSDISKIKDIIISSVKDVSKEEHIENIGYLKAVKKELIKEKEYAITNGICPRCNSKLKIKGNNFKCPNCDFKFSL